MEDDIDIEEHDVLDHPHLRNIFPDLSRIKTEVPDDEYEDSELQYENYDDCEQDMETTRYSNKIILGSKPPVRIKKEREELEEENNGEAEKEDDKINHEEEEEEEMATTSSVNGQSVLRSMLILGNKPAYISDLNSGAYSLQEEEKNDRPDSPDAHNDLDDDDDGVDDVDYEIKDSVVSLVDWGPKLRANPCYCTKCEILFPTINTLEAHNMVAHSFLVALEVNKAYKSTAKPNVAKKLTNTGKFCNHCNKMFPDSDTLINHLYQSLIIDKNKGLFKKEADKPKVQPIEEDSLPTPVKVLKTDLEAKPVVDQNNDPKLYLTCHICSCHFMKKNVYEAHMRSCHRVCGDLKYEKKPFNMHCKFCPSFITLRPNYNTHIKQFHINFYLKKWNRTVPESNLNVKYRCVKCNAVLSSYGVAREHRSVMHPTLSGMPLFKKIIMRINTGNKNEQKPKPPLKPESSVDVTPLIPRSVVYTCGQCSLYFTTCISATSHSKSCQGILNPKLHWRCIYCKRYFLNSDRATHTAQHKCSLKIVKYLWTKDLYGRILNKCPHCLSCLHEKEFWVHWQEKCKGMPVKCACCHYNIHNSCIDEHIKWHQKCQFTKKDMIVVEFDVSDKDKKVVQKRKLKVQTTDYKKTLGYCKNCQCYMQLLSNPNIAMHIAGKCKKKVIKLLCKTCGLTVTRKGHTNMHKADPTLTLLDIKFVTLKDWTLQICPAMPTFQKCATCKRLHCRTIYRRMDHNCSDPVKVCNICKMVYSDLAYKLHMPFHEYAKRFYGGKPVKSSSPKPSTSKSATLDLQDIMANYKKLGKSWNILYRCETCDVVCDDYDKAVEHSQNHINNLESYDTIIKHCKTCDLKFNSACFEKHKELHSRKAVVQKDKFQILNYSYNNLLTGNWLRVFKPLPRAQAKFIMSKSIYANTRARKMRVVKDSSSDVAIYKCGKCELLVHPLSVITHMEVRCTVSELHCDFCAIPCATAMAKTYHENQHDYASDFKVVMFNEYGDEDFNAKLKSFKKVILEDRKNVLDESEEGSAIPKKGIHYYVCTKCKSSISRLDNTKVHGCCKPGNFKLCLRCNLYFYQSHFRKHVQRHKKYKFDKNSIKVTEFTPNTDKGVFHIDFEIRSTETARLYKCVCGLHFNNIPSDKHYSLCGSDVKIYQENCSKCKRLFSTSELVTHLCKHHSNGKNPKFEIIPVGPQNRPTIFKCSSCSTYFHDKSSCMLHSCRSKDQKCDKCGLVFKNLFSHEAFVKDCSKIIEKDYKVVLVRKNTESLFKCAKCNLFFLSSKGLKLHLIDNHDSVTKKTTCRKCNRDFILTSLSKHVLLHHKNGKNSKDLAVFTGTYLKGKYLLSTNKKVKGKLHVQEKNAFNKSPVREKYAIKCYSNKSLTDTEKTDLILREKHTNFRFYNENLYKCGVCEVHFSIRKALRSHMKENSHDEEQENCKKCGLKFTSGCIKRHYKMHHENMKLKKKDFVINLGKPEEVLAVEDDETQDDQESEVKTIDPNKVLYKCELCNVHFNVERSFVYHFSQVHVLEKFANIARAQCSECFLFFSSSSLKKHKNEQHNMKVNLTRSDMYVMTYNRFGDYFGSEHVFQCAKCNVHFMKFSKLIDHSAFDDCIIRSSRCNKCGLLFKESHLDVHVKVHHEGMKLSKKDLFMVQSHGNGIFKLLQDNRRDENMYDESEDVNVDSDENDEISAPYNDKLMKPDAAKDYTLYECRKCFVSYLSNKSRMTHENDPKHARPSTVIECPICNVMFTKNSLTRHTRMHHSNAVTKSVESDAYVAVPKTGNSIQPTDKSIQETDKSKQKTDESIQETEESNKVADQLDNIDKKSNDDSMCSILNDSSIEQRHNYLYKCSVCPLHFMATRTLQTHYEVFRHYPKVETKACTECGRVFTKRIIARHMSYHHEDPNVGQDIQIMEDIYLSKVPEPADKFGCKLYICHLCMTNFNTYRNLLQHLKQCSSKENKTSEARVYCETCNLKFLDKLSLKLHKDKQHVKYKYTLENIQILDLNCDAFDKNTVLQVNDENEVYNDEDSVITDTIETKTDNALKRNAEELEPKHVTDEITVLNQNLYTKQIYKCCKCDLCFISKANIEWHMQKNHHNEAGVSCSYCDLKFPALTLVVHGFIHHQKLQLKKEDFEIIISDSTDIDINEPSCSFQSKKPRLAKECEPFEVIIIDDNEKDVTLLEDVKAANSDIDMLEIKSNDEDKSNVHSYVEIADSSGTSNQSMNDTGKDEEPKDYKMKLFKCAPCNVCFITQFSINKHLKRHTPMDPKDYIECKLCGYQFMIINTLHAHMTKHLKNEFNPDEILIEEYNPNKLINGVPKKDVYFGRDKVQSNLISTTCESSSITDKTINIDVD